LDLNFGGGPHPQPLSQIWERGAGAWVCGFSMGLEGWGVDLNFGFQLKKVTSYAKYTFLGRIKN
jgi:hypothetical protein